MRTWIATPIVAVLLLAVSIATIFVHPQIAARWGIAGGIDWARFGPLSLIPALGAAGLAITVVGLARKSHRLPFLGGVLTFLSGYLGLAVGFFPYVAPYALTYEQAASAPNALALMLVFEGLFPFLSPGGWRRTFQNLMQLRDGQLRFFGLVSIVVGLVTLWLVL